MNTKTISLFTVALAITLVGCGSKEAAVDENAGKATASALKAAEGEYGKAKALHAKVNGDFNALSAEDRAWFVGEYSHGNENSARMTWAQIGGSKNAGRGGP